MQLHALSKTTEKAKRRLGQGHGSGRVKTGGRGTKGQKARNHVPLRFEGGALPLIKRLPFLRGKQKNKSFRAKAVVLNVSDLNAFPAKSVIGVETLVKQNLLDAQEAKKGVKILGEGALTVALTVRVAVSATARKKIEQAGGTVENQETTRTTGNGAS
jgi:large subunit ribosomal protein L15